MNKLPTLDFWNSLGVLDDDYGLFSAGVVGIPDCTPRSFMIARTRENGARWARQG